MYAVDLARFLLGLVGVWCVTYGAARLADAGFGALHLRRWARTAEPGWAYGGYSRRVFSHELIRAALRVFYWCAGMLLVTAFSSRTAGAGLTAEQVSALVGGVVFFFGLAGYKTGVY